ncbi:uncharacterized protein LOC129317173 [Prosopis cineraria]|nr:uncharacterized protein LOC129317173 [Prosopis cineraria]
MTPGAISAPTSSLDTAALVSKGSDSNHKNQKGKVTCEHCKKIGHTRDTCWDIHGKPADWKPKKGKQRSYQTSHDVPPDKPDSIPEIDKEQLGKLLEMLSVLQKNEKNQKLNPTASVAHKGPLIGEDDWQC